jgi:hypothetical protein
MISAFDVYLVMQLDRISSGVGAIAIISSVFVAGSLVGWFINADIDEDMSAAAKRLCLRFSLVAAPLVIVWALIPSSKTAAAMILVPALTSEEVVEPVAAEARELYGLAKDALRGLAERDEPKSGD